MKTSEITAKILKEWSHPRCKFYPGDKVRIEGKHITAYDEQRYQKYDGMEGTIVAVTCKNGSIRGTEKIGKYNLTCRRQYTKYYVEFADGNCIGLHSHYYEKI
jgi:hypothetical protein